MLRLSLLLLVHVPRSVVATYSAEPCCLCVFNQTDSDSAMADVHVERAVEIVEIELLQD